jgi:hypothetical protein
LYSDIKSLAKAKKLSMKRLVLGILVEFFLERRR